MTISEFERFQNALAENGSFQESYRESLSGPIVVLHVDDEPDLADLTATFLEREYDNLEVVTDTTAGDALARLDDADIDCIVSDYDMPDMNGLELLEEVRDRNPNLPFVLFTGKGSEEIASDAISAGVTDYLQKETGTSQYPVLANRVINAVEQYRAKRAFEQAQRRFGKLIEKSTDVISIISADAQFQYLSPSAEHILGYEPEEMVGEHIFDYAHPDDQQEAMAQFFEAVKDPGQRPVVEFRFKHKDGSWPVLESRGRNLLDDPDIEGFVVNSREITELKERKQELERQNDQLTEIKNVVSHDLKNPLTVALNALELLRETGDDEYADKIERSLRRADEIIDDMSLLTRHGRQVGETDEVALESVVAAAWEMVDTGQADLTVVDSRQFVADESRVQQLAENVLSNAVQHGGEDISVEVGTMDGGFYIADDGAGIPAADREAVFESGYSTAPDGTGFGLAIVRQIAMAHGWDVSATESASGGARFEITGIESVPSR